MAQSRDGFLTLLAVPANRYRVWHATSRMRMDASSPIQHLDSPDDLEAGLRRNGTSARVSFIADERAPTGFHNGKCALRARS